MPFIEINTNEGKNIYTDMDNLLQWDIYCCINTHNSLETDYAYISKWYSMMCLEIVYPVCENVRSTPLHQDRDYRCD